MVFILVTGISAMAKNYSVSKFTELDIWGPYKITFVQSNDHFLKIYADDDVLENINVEQNGEKLTIQHSKKKNINNKNSIEMVIGFSDLKLIQINGAVNLDNDDKLVFSNLKVFFDGAGEVNLNMQCDKLIADINGVGGFHLRGSANYHKLDFSGVGEYDASEFKAKYTSVSSNGIGNVKVYASEKLIVDVSGIGSLEYYGSPKEKDINASGIGSVKDKS